MRGGKGLKIGKLKVISILLFGAIILSACYTNSETKTSNTTQQQVSEEANIDEGTSKEEVVAPNFEVSKDKLISKLDSSSNYTKSEDTNGMTMYN